MTRAKVGRSRWVVRVLLSGSAGLSCSSLVDVDQYVFGGRTTLCSSEGAADAATAVCALDPAPCEADAGCAVPACSTASDCTGGACVDGRCVDCEPASVGCVENVPRVCSLAGRWIEGAECSGDTPICDTASATCVCSEAGPSSCVSAAVVRACSGGVLVDTPCADGQRCLSDRCREARWVRQIGSTLFDQAYSIGGYDNGDVAVVGTVGGQLPGQTSGGSSDGFAGRFDIDGNVVWLRQFGTNAEDTGFSGSIDAAGNLFVTGSTAGTWPDKLSAGGLDGYVRKYDPDGNELWTRQFGSSVDDSGSAVSVDSTGNVLVVGWTAGTLPNQMPLGGSDAFAKKFDNAGNELWTRQFGSTSADFAWAVAVDRAANVLIAGDTGETPTGGNDAFVRKLDAAGNDLWVKPLGSMRDDESFGIDVDAQNNIVWVGTTLTAPADPDTEGHYDAFVRKLDPAGNELWQQQFGSPDEDGASAVDTDAAGNIVVVGYTYGALTPEPNAGETDAFIRRCDPAGNEVSTRQFGTALEDDAYATRLEDDGRILVAGYTYGVLGATPSAGESDGYVLREPE